MGRIIIGTLGLALAISPVTGVFATADAATAVDGHAEAVAAEVDGIVAVAHAEANAGPQNGNTATASALELGDKPPAAQFGGTQTGTGQASGGLVDTGKTDLGQIELLPWSATVDQRSAVARAALARLKVADAASVDVLQSESRATYDTAADGSTSSTGSSSSDGAVANVGGDAGITTVLLHAQADSGDSGTGSYLLAINGNKIGTSDDANGACLFELPSLARITCLSADGGAAGNPTNFEAAVLDAVIGGDQGLAGRITAAGGNHGSGTGSNVLAASNDGPRGETLPFTGGRAWISLIGLALLAAAGFTYRMRRVI